MRKPLTGLLTMRIHAVKDVDHAASSRFSRGPETYVVVKVEDAIKARTKATRNDRWLDEGFSMDIDKANEIELTVYDKAGDRPTPIGMLWVRISDIAEEMRRKKIETELNASGWVSADKMADGGSPRHDHTGSPMGSSHGASPGGRPGTAGHGAHHGGESSNAPPTVMLDSWFALDPVGRVQLQMSFGKTKSCHYQIKVACVLTGHSQAIEGPSSLRHWSEPSRCSAPKEGGGSREAGSQICHSTVLQHHALCAMWRIPQVCCWHAVRGLQVHLSPQVLLQGCHKVYQQGQLRDRPRRGEDQPPYSPSLRGIFQYFRKLVLPLWLPSSIWTQKCQALLW